MQSSPKYFPQVIQDFIQFLIFFCAIFHLDAESAKEKIHAMMDVSKVGWVKVMLVFSNIGCLKLFSFGLLPHL